MSFIAGEYKCEVEHFRTPCIVRSILPGIAARMLYEGVRTLYRAISENQ